MMSFAFEDQCIYSHVIIHRNKTSKSLSDVSHLNLLQEKNISPTKERTMETATNQLPIKGNHSGPSDLSQEALPPTSGYKFHKILADKDKKLSKLEKQNLTLSNKLRRLKRIEHEASRKVFLLEAEESWEDEEKACPDISLEQQQEESRRVKTALAQVQTQIEIQRKESLEEKTALKCEIEQLKQQIQSHKTETSGEITVLYVELAKKDKLNADATSTVNQLEADISAQRTRKTEAEAGLSQKIEETLKLKDALVRMQQEMKDKKHQWEQDKSHLLFEQLKATSNMNANIMEVHSVLENNQQQWHLEKVSLLETISDMKEALRKKEEERKTSTKALMDRMKSLDKQLDTVTNEKTKKKSLWKRFIQLFK